MNPSPAAWDESGTTLATLVKEDGLVLRDVRRSFVFDILIARSCREMGAILISRNATDLSRIAKLFAFDFVPPYPVPEPWLNIAVWRNHYARPSRGRQYRA